MHFYQGGNAFHYPFFNPGTGKLECVILGPDILNCHRFQLAVPGEFWKCGSLFPEVLNEKAVEGKQEYSIIGEAIGSCFDFHKCMLVTKDMVSTACRNVSREIQFFLPSLIKQECDALTLTKDRIGFVEKFYSDGH